jgi:hypothetical protein
VVGIFRHSTTAGSAAYWYVDWNGNGTWSGTSSDRYWQWGMNGDKPAPVLHGYGGAQLSVYRAGTWIIDTGNRVWDGCGVDSCTSFGSATDVPFADPNGHIGTSQGLSKFLDANGNKSWGAGDVTQSFGPSGWQPLLGYY